MEPFSALLTLCAGKSPVTGEFPTQGPETRSFDVFFDVRWINAWVNNREAGDLRRHCAHYAVIVMDKQHVSGDVCTFFRFWGNIGLTPADFVEKTCLFGLLTRSILCRKMARALQRECCSSSSKPNELTDQQDIFRFNHTSAFCTSNNILKNCWGTKS